MTQPQPAGNLQQQINVGLDTLGRHNQASHAVFFEVPGVIVENQRISLQDLALGLLLRAGAAPYRDFSFTSPRAESRGNER